MIAWMSNSLMPSLDIADQTAPCNSLDPHFTFLYQLLKDNYDGYSSYIFATTSAILLMIGWFITSKDARIYIARQSWIKIFMLIGIVIFIGAEIYFSYCALHTSDNIVFSLQNIVRASGCSLVDTYYKSKIVQKCAVNFLIVLHTVLYIILAAIIWSISIDKEDAGSKSR